MPTRTDEGIELAASAPGSRAPPTSSPSQPCDPCQRPWDAGPQRSGRSFVRRPSLGACRSPSGRRGRWQCAGRPGLALRGPPLGWNSRSGQLRVAARAPPPTQPLPPARAAAPMGDPSSRERSVSCGVTSSSRLGRVVPARRSRLLVCAAVAKRFHDRPRSTEQLRDLPLEVRPARSQPGAVTASDAAASASSTPQTTDTITHVQVHGSPHQWRRGRDEAPPAPLRDCPLGGRAQPCRVAVRSSCRKRVQGVLDEAVTARALRRCWRRQCPCRRRSPARRRRSACRRA